MAVITRRLHMGCGETLQSHLPESFRKLTSLTETRQKKMSNNIKLPEKKGRFWK
ncbi:MAG: hypothetical protein OEY52_05000 [Gammaproteobacteria bacterium]|nr:hypothetical protein [Gammaproteobacteria bacterium]